MINLVLHPGHSKCGSTTIQDFIYKNRQRFFNRGIFLPDSNFNFPGQPGYNIDHTHTPRDYLAEVQRGNISIAELEQKLDLLCSKAESLGCRRVIISAENLINAIGHPSTAQIHELLNKKFASVNIVYYIRRQDSLLVSAWQQWGHKTGESQESYVDKMMRTKFCDFKFISNQLRRYYPKAKLNVFPLDKNELINNNLLEDFCKRAVIKFEGLDSNVPNSNSGLSSALCSTVGHIHGVYEDVHDQKVKAVITNMTPNSAHLRDKKYKNELSKEQMSKAAEMYEEKNKFVADKYFPDVNFERVLSIKSLLEENFDEKFLLDKIEKLEDIVAIQMDMILSLNKKIK